MASLPPSQRRQQPTHRRDSNQSSSSQPALQPALQPSDSEAHSTVSEDSQTVLLNPSSSKVAVSDQEESGNAQAPQQQHTPAEEAWEPNRCWICFSDETEDTPTSSEWRRPCPCALTAHEACLLDWIADMEAPNSRRQKGPNDKIQCPQCKAQIVLARPKRYVVDAVRQVELWTGRLVLPGALTIGATSFWYLCWVHGVSSVYLVFGPHDADEILAPVLRVATESDSNLQAAWHHIRARWRLDIGLSLIPTMLIASRARIADGVLPILPMLFFVTKLDSDPLLDLGTWPPSAGLSFALLPYLRSLYNTYYERVWADHEKRWLREIQPRARTAEAEAAQDAGGPNLDNEENVLEINVDLGVVEEDDWEEDDAQPPAIQRLRRVHPLNAPPLPDELGGAPEIAAVPAHAPLPDGIAHNLAGRGNVPAQAAARQNDLRNGNFNLAVSTYSLASSVLGALAFPALSTGIGELLRLALPKSLTGRVVGRGGKPTGLLQARWGRSIVGGCLFVVLKDAVMLYVRWRMAKDHRMRRVCDYEGLGGKGRGRNSTLAGAGSVGLSGGR
ncbi:hypothetical protein E6O75_ATG04439 [Venturia nashicola]|uniref:RING-CH-type domain-containing protein n=1 Tax=Venturia nashicola TaxID=86259 RepID=A0A4Z1PRF5_9PEZI|nr:hypothetical protein E6O75_ATG04439 [Venturia nashicola]